MNRSGTVLIIVAAICALLASLTLTFLVRTRSSVEETNAFEAGIQARIMLVAACTYVCEASRIGYEPLVADPANGPHHVEAFGWIDVRDGSIGPNTRDYGAGTVAGSLARVPLWDAELKVPTGLTGSLPTRRPAWPAIGSVARCPMYSLVRPPFAIELTAVYNPLNDTNGTPLLLKPDPQPFRKTLAEYQGADATARLATAGRAWFRVHRDGPATFVITVGAGATQGWRDYAEVAAAGAEATAEFNDDPRYFASLLAQEARMWYRIEWSPTVEAPDGHNVGPSAMYDDWGGSALFPLYPVNNSDSLVISSDTRIALGSQSHPCNQGGTIRWVQRLRQPPLVW